jgi:hypothetical protein
MVKRGVTKPGKNRKRRFNAPNHVRRKFLSAPLSPSLKIEYGARSMPIRRDDTVTITKGDRKLTEGKVIRVDGSDTHQARERHDHTPRAWRRQEEGDPRTARVRGEEEECIDGKERSNTAHEEDDVAHLLADS